MENIKEKYIEMKEQLEEGVKETFKSAYKDPIFKLLGRESGTRFNYIKEEILCGLEKDFQMNRTQLIDWLIGTLFIETLKEVKA